MKLIYGIKDKPKFGQLLIFALQQLLAIMAATLVVPVIIGNGMQPAAALFGAGIGTLVYVLFTKANSPVFLGSSFAFLGSMAAAFAGGVSMQLGYLGLLLGAAFAGLVYVVIAIIVKLAGVKWINKLMPAVVIGPTVAIIGLSLAKNAIGDLTKTNIVTGSPYVALICGLITLAVTMLCATYGKKMLKLIPFIIGILAGYLSATILYFIGKAADIPALMIIDFSAFANMGSIFALPEFTFLTAFKGIGEINGAYIGTIAAAYVPVAFVVFAEHIADHKNLSTIIEQDLLENPGLHRTLLGDGIGSVAGAIFGGCPNTTYGESVGCVAITKNASVSTIITAAIGAILISCIAPFVAFVNTIPSCVMGGVCMALYGFIAVSGLKMIKNVDLEQNRNLFVVSVILIAGIGGLSLSFGQVTITNIATALILGILANLMLGKAKEQ
ncbi:MAG: uracil-xanthine permease [Clostridia bacterium]|nr:uracil-xanthine permease [Oscillospiraceae bacterium]MBQ7033531.1 uracil-xanthine permease [Clostridia bacterium]